MAALLNMEAAVAKLRAGGLVAFPAETVYGLGADASNAAAVARIFTAKGRPADHPLIVHIARMNELRRWVQEVPEAAWRLAKRFWPGPLTLVFRRGERASLVSSPAASTLWRCACRPIRWHSLCLSGSATDWPLPQRTDSVD